MKLALPFHLLRQVLSIENHSAKDKYDSKHLMQRPKSAYPKTGWILFGTLLTALLTEVVIYFVGNMTPRFYGLLLLRDYPGFWKLVLISTGLLVLSAILKSALHYGSGLFALRARAILTLHLQSAYFQPQVFRQLNSSDNVSAGCYGSSNSHPSISSPLIVGETGTGETIDNPDQRLSQDIDQWCSVMRVIVEQLIASPLMIIYYSYQTAQISGYIAPCAVYLYFIVNLLICRPLLPRLVHLTYIKERQEGNFRYFHQRSRHFADSIYMLRGESYENRFLSREFMAILTTQQSILNREYFVRMLTTFISEFGSIISFLMIAVPVFTGRLDKLDSAALSTLISQNTFYTMYLIYKFTSITEMADLYSQLIGYSERIKDMWDNLQHSEVITDINNVHLRLSQSVDRRKLDIVGGEMKLPDGRLARVPSFEFPLCTAITAKEPSLTLISGPAGAGKSTLLRCIFDFLSPQLALDGRDVMFLPQRSYLPARSPSSLEAWEEFVLYPLLPENGDELMTVDRERLQRIFDQLSFSLPQSSQQKTDDYAAISIEQDDMTAEKFNSEDPRSTDPIYRLSPGERQKLALVAALFFQPNWLFMDEPFSSLDSPTITAVLSFLYASNTNCLIITHQPEIVETHWPGQWRQRIQLI